MDFLVNLLCSSSNGPLVSCLVFLRSFLAGSHMGFLWGTISRHSSWDFWRKKRTRQKIIPNTIEKPFYLALMTTKSMVGRRNITLCCWCQRKWAPFLHGSSLHPEEPLCKKGSYFLIMPLSTEVTTLPTTYFSSPMSYCSGLHSIPAMITPALLSSCCYLTAMPSHCLILPADCCIPSCCTALLLSSHSATLLSSCTGWLLHRLLSCRPLVLSLCCPLVLSSFSQSAVLLSSHCTGWLLHCLLLHCPLVVLSLRCPLVILLQLVVALPLVALPSCPLVMLPSHPLFVLSLGHPVIVSSHWLVVALPLVVPPSCCPLTPPLSCRDIIEAGRWPGTLGRAARSRPRLKVGGFSIWDGKTHCALNLRHTVAL